MPGVRDGRAGRSVTDGIIGLMEGEDSILPHHIPRPRAQRQSMGHGSQ